MATSLRQDFETDFLKTIVDDIQFQRASYYYTLGNIASVPAGSITLAYNEDRAARSEVVFVKKVLPNDISLMIRRIPWVSGTVYDYWDDGVDMSSRNFYVITSQANVYKCLDNKTYYGGAGNPSTVEPSQISLYPFTTTDGYVWKYMYTIPEFGLDRFATTSYVPVKRAVSDSFYNNGAVTTAVVLAQGTNYTSSTSTTITVDNTNTTGSGATATLTVDANGTITAINMVTVGSGYTKGVQITATGGFGADLQAGTIGPNGELLSVNVIAGGISYNALTSTIAFTTGGAILLPVVSGGSIVDVKIINGGAGYLSAPTLTVVGSGSRKYANSPAGPGLSFRVNSGSVATFAEGTAIVRAVESGGSIVGVEIIDPGQQYSSNATTTINATGNGTGAAFTPVVYGGKVIDVVVDNPGRGYTDIALSISGSPGTGASVKGIIEQSDFTSQQSIIEQGVVEGAIYKIVVTNGGSGYTSPPALTIVGDGTGLAATAVIESGIVKYINVTNPGSGYTYATITPANAPAGGTTAVLRAVIPPYGGHGRDAPVELLASAVSINTLVKQEITDLNLQQLDFRSFGLLKNPVSITSGSRLMVDSELIVYEMKCSSLTGVTLNTVFTFGQTPNPIYRYRVVSFDATTSSIMLTPLTSQSIAPLGTLTSDPAGTQITTTATLSTFDIDKYSGRLIYFSTETAFKAATDQSVVFKTLITI